MPIQGILEEDDDESDSIVMVLREHPNTMTAIERKRWLRTLERNMSQLDLYDKDNARSKNR